ncbi:hypothetical protein ACIQUZ_09665 [Streptomyces griseus]|uniref:hypothetical protein n=1 Tax=Streptomyces griseus TaxID=1911 RepID=UPI003816E0B9
MSAALAPLGAGLPVWATIWILVGLVCWQIAYDPGAPSGRRVRGLGRRARAG